MTSEAGARMRSRELYIDDRDSRLDPTGSPVTFGKPLLGPAGRTPSCQVFLNQRMREHDLASAKILFHQAQGLGRLQDRLSLLAQQVAGFMVGKTDVRAFRYGAARLQCVDQLDQGRDERSLLG